MYLEIADLPLKQKKLWTVYFSLMLIRILLRPHKLPSSYQLIPQICHNSISKAKLVADYRFKMIP
jgi:hypothetical protein